MRDVEVADREQRAVSTSDGMTGESAERAGPCVSIYRLSAPGLEMKVPPCRGTISVIQTSGRDRELARRPPYQNDHLPDEATPGLLRSICRTSCPDRRASLGFPDSIPDRIAMNLESRSFRLAKNSGPIPFADPVGATPRRLEW